MTDRTLATHIDCNVSMYDRLSAQNIIHCITVIANCDTVYSCNAANMRIYFL